MSPLASWWFYVPFLLFIPAIIARFQVDKHKDTAQIPAGATNAPGSRLETFNRLRYHWRSPLDPCQYSE